jgi:hypothetical protein
MNHSRTTLLTALAFLAVWQGPARADILAGTNGRCPSTMTPYVKYGKTHCKSAPKAEPKKAAEGKSSRSSGSSSGGVYVDPVVHSVPKANKLGFCPSGYYTNDDACTTPWDAAPRVTRKAGACPAGTVSEHGAYCTAVIADLSDDTLDRLDGFATRDFNVVYTTALVAGAKPAEPVRGEAFAQAVAKRQAAGDPWEDVRARNAKKAAIKTPEQLAYDKQQSEQEAHRQNEFAKMCAQIRQAYAAAMPADHECAKAPAPVTSAAHSAQAVSDSGKDSAKKEVSKVLKGLLGR